MDAVDKFMSDLLRDLAQHSTNPTNAAAFARAAQTVEQDGVDAVRRQFVEQTPGPLVEQIVVGGRA